jgi:hypothetical protein
MASYSARQPPRRARARSTGAPADGPPGARLASRSRRTRVLRRALPGVDPRLPNARATIAPRPRTSCRSPGAWIICTMTSVSSSGWTVSSASSVAATNSHPIWSSASPASASSSRWPRVASWSPGDRPRHRRGRLPGWLPLLSGGGGGSSSSFSGGRGGRATSLLASEPLSGSTILDPSPLRPTRDLGGHRRSE